MAKRKVKIETKIEEIIQIPSEINASVEGNEVIMKKDNKEIRKKIDGDIKLSMEGNNIKLIIQRAKKDERRKFGTARSHIKNMIEGITEGFEYELEICNVHFPITVTYDKSKSEFIIKNFLGEKAPRILKATGNIEVEIKAPHIKIRSPNIEEAGQVAANLEKASKIRNRDRNKFQDGIFITKKPGKSYL